jgi:hypothetical protein
MDDSIHNDELLRRYLNNELDPGERSKLASTLQNDAVMRQRLESLEVTMEALRQVGTMETVKGIHGEMMKELKKKETAPVKKLVRRTLAIAAAIIILIVVTGGWWFFQLSPENVYTENYRSYTMGSSRGTADKDIISTLYINRNYQEIILRSATQPLSAHDSLLVAISYLETNILPQAIKWFSALQSGRSQFRQDADYYLAMAYLRNKEYQNALQLMKQIKKDPNHLYRKEISDKLLRSVRMLQWK